MRLNYNTSYFKHNLYRNDRMWQMQETGFVGRLSLSTAGDKLRQPGKWRAWGSQCSPARFCFAHSRSSANWQSRGALRHRDGEMGSQGEHSPSCWNTQATVWMEGGARQTGQIWDAGTAWLKNGNLPCPGGRWVKTVSAPPFFSRTICPTTTSSFFSPRVSLSLNTRTHTNSLWPSTCPHLLRLAY